MDREEATKALELLRQVVTQARDDSAMQKWGVIWILHAFTNAGGFIATQVLIWRGVRERWPFVAMWAGILAFNIGSIFVLKARRAGARSFVENQIWAIWLTFIGAVGLLALVNDLMGQELFFLGPVVGVLSAVGFSSMGAVIGSRWYAGTAIFSVASVAMALLPELQFIILGAVWGIAQLAGGIWLEWERRRRLSGQAAIPRLV
jgi:hypothetical protein